MVTLALVTSRLDYLLLPLWEIAVEEGSETASVPMIFSILEKTTLTHMTPFIHQQLHQFPLNVQGIRSDLE